jgi:hypothetical protein
MGRTCSTNGEEKKNACKILVGKPEGKRPLVRPRRVLCDCEAVVHIRLRHLGQFFMEPSDYYDAPIDEVLHFIRGVRLIKG